MLYLWVFFLIFSGEIEEVGAQRYQKISPSIHETHFEEDIDLPTTVLHHPGIYIACTIFKNQSCLFTNFSNYKLDDTYFLFFLQIHFIVNLTVKADRKGQVMPAGLRLLCWNNILGTTKTDLNLPWNKGILGTQIHTCITQPDVYPHLMAP